MKHGTTSKTRKPTWEHFDIGLQRTTAHSARCVCRFCTQVMKSVEQNMTHAFLLTSELNRRVLVPFDTAGIKEMDLAHMACIATQNDTLSHRQPSRYLWYW